MVKRLILVVLMLALFGATSAQDDAIPADTNLQGVTVVYWHQFNSGAQLETMTALIEKFNAENPHGIVVEALAQGGYGEIAELMNAGIISGELPNLVPGYQNNMASYFSDEAIVPLDRYLTDANWGYSEEELLDFNTNILDINRFPQFEGQMLGWPNLISANLLAVNLTMLNELGFESEPVTLEQFKEVACVVAESGLKGAEDRTVQGYPIKPDASNLESFVAGFGGDIYDYENDMYAFTSPEVLTALQMYADIYANGCAYIPDTRFGNTDDFAFGWNPMALGSTAGIPFIISNFEKSGVAAEWTIATTPVLAEGDTPAINIFLPSLIMVKGTEEEQLATWEFIKFLSAPEQQATWTQATAYLPTRVSVSLQVPYLLDEADPQFKFIVELNDILFSNSVRVFNPPKTVSYGSVRNLMAEAVSNVTANGMSVEDAAQLLQDAAEQLRADLD